MSSADIDMIKAKTLARMSTGTVEYYLRMSLEDIRDVWHVLYL